MCVVTHEHMSNDDLASHQPRVMSFVIIFFQLEISPCVTRCRPPFPQRVPICVYVTSVWGDGFSLDDATWLQLLRGSAVVWWSDLEKPKEDRYDMTSDPWARPSGASILATYCPAFSAAQGEEWPAFREGKHMQILRRVQYH